MCPSADGAWSRQFEPDGYHALLCQEDDINDKDANWREDDINKIADEKDAKKMT